MTLERFKIFDNFIEGIQVIDRSFRYHYINQAAAAHGKSTTALLTGKTMTESYPGIENTPLYEKIGECMHLRIPGKFINQFTFNDGGRGFFDIRLEPIEEGVLIMSFDVSEQRNTELELDDRINEVEKQLTLITGQKKQLEDFCHIIAHNMRGPLSNLLLLNNMVQSASSEEERMLMISKQKPVIDFLNETFDELVNATSVMIDPEVKFDHVNLERSTKKVLTRLEGTIIEAGAQVSFDFNKHSDLYFPEKYLDNIIFNLVENALKYRAPYRPLKLELLSYSKNGHIYLDVKDNGLGIDLVKHGSKIFRLRKTFHAHPHARGFGLFQVKNQLEAIGGSIDVSSLPDVGTTFTVRLNKV